MGRHCPFFFVFCFCLLSHLIACVALLRSALHWLRCFACFGFSFSFSFGFALLCILFVLFAMSTNITPQCVFAS